MEALLSLWRQGRKLRFGEDDSPSEVPRAVQCQKEEGGKENRPPNTQEQRPRFNLKGDKTTVGNSEREGLLDVHGIKISCQKIGREADESCEDYASEYEGDVKQT